MRAARVPKRDCRDCRMFTPSPTGLQFGWCDAYDQYVKLYHPPGEFWSQCQFKALSRAWPGAEHSPASEQPSAVIDGQRDDDRHGEVPEHSAEDPGA